LGKWKTDGKASGEEGGEGEGGPKTKLRNFTI
jgi:hypothetical protein